MGKLFRLGADLERIFWIFAEETKLQILIRLSFPIFFFIIPLPASSQYILLPSIHMYEQMDSLETAMKDFRVEIKSARGEVDSIHFNKKAGIFFAQTYHPASHQTLDAKQAVLPLKLLQKKVKMSEPLVQDMVQKKEEQKNTLEQEISFANMYARLYVTAGILSLFGLGILGILLRKLALKKKKLEKAICEIERHNKAKDFFMGIIAHDLRRPLSTLHEMAELADYYIKTNRYESLQKISGYIDQSGANIRHLLDNMINWSLSQEGRYQPQTISVASKIDNVLELYSQDILRKQIQLHYECPASLTAYVDGNGLELIIRNLIDNALKHLPANGILTIKATELSFDVIRIIISDNGPGMSPEKTEQVKYILAHAEEVVPGQIGRTLGMLITGRFVILNKGTIDVDSQLNQGTTFTLTFPTIVG